MVGRNPRDRRPRSGRRTERLPSRQEPLRHQISFGTLAIDVCEGVAERPFTDAHGFAERRDRDRLVGDLLQHSLGFGDDIQP